MIGCRRRCHVGPVRSRSTMELLVVARSPGGRARCCGQDVAIITATFEGSQRARAIGLWSAATSALTILGPLAGGVLVDSLSWRAAFLVNVPLVLVALYAAWRHVPESRNEDAPRRLDWLGSLVIAIAVGGISFGLIRGQDCTGATRRQSSCGTGSPPPSRYSAHGQQPDPWAARVVPGTDFTVFNVSTFLIYGPHTRLPSERVPPRRLDYTRWDPRPCRSGGLPAHLFSHASGRRREGRRQASCGGAGLMAAGMASCGASVSSATLRQDMGGGLGRHPWTCSSTWCPRSSSRHRHHARGRAPHHHPHGLGPGGERGPWCRDQQRGVAGRPAAAAGRDLPRHQRPVLRHAGRPRAGAGYHLGCRAELAAAAHPAFGGGRPGHRSRGR